MNSDHVERARPILREGTKANRDTSYRPAFVLVPRPQGSCPRTRGHKPRFQAHGSELETAGTEREVPKKGKVQIFWL